MPPVAPFPLARPRRLRRTPWYSATWSPSTGWGLPT